jgi:hypothetical protein
VAHHTRLTQRYICNCVHNFCRASAIGPPTAGNVINPPAAFVYKFISLAGKIVKGGRPASLATIYATQDPPFPLYLCNTGQVLNSISVIGEACAIRRRDR